MLFVLAFVLAVIPALIYRPYWFEDCFSEGNRYRDGTVTVRAIDCQSRQLVQTFHAKVIYGDRNLDPRFNEDGADGFQGLAIFDISYPTFHYRQAGRPFGFTFFDKYKLEVSASGYKTASLPFPVFVVKGRQFPPTVLPPIVIELQKDRNE